MSTRILSTLTGAALALAAATAAEAAVVDFTFDTATTGWQNSLSYSLGGLDLTVEAEALPAFGFPTDAQVRTVGGRGIGVRSEALDSPFIDGRNLSDFAIFSFSEAVTLVSAGFTRIEPDDDFVLAADLGSGLQIVATGTVAALLALPGIASATFAIGAAPGRDNEFMISGLSVETRATPVPLPAGGLMLAAGMGALALLRRRKPA